jgi:hypothetical protein
MLNYYIWVIILTETPSVRATRKLVQDRYQRVFKDDVMCEWIIKVFGWSDKLRIEEEFSHTNGL